MRVFLAGATGAVSRHLLPLLVENGHEVVALVRTAEKARAVEAVGAKAALADALDSEALTTAITGAEPEAIIHQLTVLTGIGSLRRFDENFALTNRLRTEVTDTMLAAARRVGTRSTLRVTSASARSHMRHSYVSAHGLLRTVGRLCSFGTIRSSVAARCAALGVAGSP